MRLLISANLLRLRKSAAFWASMAVMAGVGVFEAAAGYLSARSMGIVLNLDNRYFIFVLVAGVVLSAFCALFLGAEYSCGTIRNKILAGHSRSAIYLANLAACAGAGVLLCLGYIVPMLAVGVPLMGWFQMELGAVLWFTLCAFLMTAALAGLFTLAAMLIQNRAVSAVACIFLAYILLFLGIYLNSRLTEPEMIPAREYVENGRILLQEAQPNPGYVQGPWRAVCELIYLLPGCQAVQLAAKADACPWYLPLASLCALAVSVGVGAALFQKKDLK